MFDSMVDPQPRRVAITGIGCLTPIGHGVDGLWKGLQRRESAVRRIRRFDSSMLRSQIAAEIDDFEPTDYMAHSRARRLDRFAQFSVAAARQALEDAGLDPAAEDPDEVAIQMGTALGGVSYAEGQLRGFLTRGLRGVDATLALNVFAGSASSNIALEFGFSGPNCTNGMSCASGAIAIGEGWRLIRDGTAEIVVAGGADLRGASRLRQHERRAPHDRAEAGRQQSGKGDAGGDAHRRRLPRHDRLRECPRLVHPPERRHGDARDPGPCSATMAIR